MAARRCWHWLSAWEWYWPSRAGAAAWEQRTMTALRQQQKKPLVMLAAGGTGEHLFPAQATARALLQRGAEVVLVTDQRGSGFQGLPGIQTRRIAAGSPRGHTLSKLRAACALGLGYLQSRRLIAELQPSAVLGFGGYPSVAPLMAARRRRIRQRMRSQNSRGLGGN